MRRYRAKVVLAAWALLPVLSQSPSSSRSLADLVQEYWQWVLHDNLDFRMKQGLKIENLPDVTLEKAQRDAALASSLLVRLHQIKPAALNEDDQITVGVLEFELRNIVEGAPFYWLHFLVTPYSSPLPVVHRVYTSYRFSGPGDLVSYLELLEKYPSFVGSIRSQLVAQSGRGIRPPKPEIELVRGFLTSYIRGPKLSIFYVNQERLKGTASAGRVREFQQRLSRDIEERINPALQRLVGTLDAEYWKRAPDAVGLSQYPDGKEYYKYLVRFHTTLDISPEEVHQIGLDVVRETEAQMELTRRKLGFGGRAEEFNHFVKTDTRFFPKRPEEMAGKMAGFVSRIQPKLETMFLHLQRAPYGIERLAPSLEGAQTFGIYHQPSATEPRGIYYFNGSDLKNRTLLNAGVLIFHELIPGHHLQTNLQRENEALPEFRRYGSYTAYTEGWACYATSLADELGMYDDPYQYFGFLAMNQFYSVRLVVDTGMNYLGWTRSRATEYMRTHLLESDAQIGSETLRYSVDLPGQALAYRMGARTIMELREKSKLALGPRFDVRQFHDWVLNIGAVPLPVLMRHIDSNIERIRHKR